MTESSRGLVAWALALGSLTGAALGFAGLWAAASWAVVTAPLVTDLFFASVPLAIAGLLVARRPTLRKAPAVVSGVALFVFAVVWVIIFAVRATG